MSVANDLEQDLSWRESELASLKLATRSINGNEVRSRAARRAYVAMLYAHYEGFSKFAFRSYLIAISRREWPIENLAPPLQTLFMQKDIAGLRSLPALEFMTAVNGLINTFKGTKIGDYEFPETSNLWPKNFKFFCEAIGIQSEYIDEQKNFIGKLVGTRNGIAHGQELYVTEGTIQDLENAVWHVMIGLSLCIVDSLEQGRFLNL